MITTTKGADARRLEKYGIDKVQFEALWVAQGGKCAICGGVLTLRTGGHAVDHDHDSGQVRGLLCPPCNVVEGCIKRTGMDPKAFANRLEKYLTDPPGRLLELA